MTDDPIAREVEDLHQFFESWINGALPGTDEAFARFDGVMADDFHIVPPEGRITTRTEIVERVRRAHGIHRDDGFRIWVRDVQVRSRLGSVVVATYEEWQALRGDERGRLSVAVLETGTDAPNGIVWHHVHETWLPDVGESR